MIRLLIADDHPIVREGLKRIVTDCPDMKIVGEAIDGDDVLARCENTTVDVLLLDVSMPGPGFLETMRRLKKEHPGVRVLVLSVHSEDQYAVRALRAGASGYLTKDHSPTELSGAIRRAYRGGKYVTESLVERLAFELEADRERLPHASLSDREYQVLCKLGSGTSVKETAVDLGLSPKTVSTYRTRVLKKMKLKTNAELIRYVLRHSLVD